MNNDRTKSPPCAFCLIYRNPEPTAQRKMHYPWDFLGFDGRPKRPVNTALLRYLDLFASIPFTTTEATHKPRESPFTPLLLTEETAGHHPPFAETYIRRGSASGRLPSWPEKQDISLYIHKRRDPPLEPILLDADFEGLERRLLASFNPIEYDLLPLMVKPVDSVRSEILNADYAALHHRIFSQINVCHPSVSGPCEGAL